MQTLREGTMDTIHNEGEQIAFAVSGKAVVTQGVDIQHHTGGVGIFQAGKAELCFCVIEIDMLKFQSFQDAEKSVGIAGEMLLQKCRVHSGSTPFSVWFERVRCGSCRNLPRASYSK